jgi:hypothetical protein
MIGCACATVLGPRKAEEERPDAMGSPVSVDWARPVDKNPPWNLSVRDQTLGEHKSSQGITKSSPRALTRAQFAIGREQKYSNESKLMALGEQSDSMTGCYCSEFSHTVTSLVRESDQYEISTVRGPTALFSWDVYISSLAGLCSLSFGHSYL